VQKLVELGLVRLRRENNPRGHGIVQIVERLPISWSCGRISDEVVVGPLASLVRMPIIPTT
jgi:hypothetical protein